MARPTKWRKIECVPAVPYFVPSEKEVKNLISVNLKLEELEAVRLKDLEGLEQGECAERMEVSRPTFQRILSSAREKIADSLINGKAINIEGGNYTFNICPVKCRGCGKEWKESMEKISEVKNEFHCPECGSVEVECDKECRQNKCKKACKGKCRN